MCSPPLQLCYKLIFTQHALPAVAVAPKAQGRASEILQAQPIGCMQWARSKLWSMRAFKVARYGHA
eukprot:1152243-Pelagomonas_calceolata.AAC.2